MANLFNQAAMGMRWVNVGEWRIKPGKMMPVLYPGIDYS